MFEFINKIFLAVKNFSVSINNQECKIRTSIKETNNNEPSFYPCSIEINKCSGSCNNINNPYVLLKTQMSEYLI